MKRFVPIIFIWTAVFLLVGCNTTTQPTQVTTTTMTTGQIITTTSSSTTTSSNPMNTTTTATTTTASLTTATTTQSSLLVEIAFDSAGGSTVPPLLALPNTTIQKPDNPTKAGYVFAGWYLQEEDLDPYVFDKMPSTNLTLIADWASEGLQYAYLSDSDSYRVFAYSVLDDSHVVISKRHPLYGLLVTTIGESAFSNCVNLEAITLPESITTLEQSAFFGCESITQITLSSNLVYIGENAFRFTKSLVAIHVPDSNPQFQSIEGVLFSKDGRKLVRYPSSKSGITYAIPSSVEIVGADAFSSAQFLQSFSLPSSVHTIETHAFFDCQELLSVVIPDTVLTIELYAFRDCIQLASVLIGMGLSVIESYVFNNCYSLQSIVIPHTITRIGYGAFYDCNQLETVYLMRPSSLGITAGSLFMFQYTRTTLVIYVVDEDSETAYKSDSYWLTYASKIQYVPSA